MTANLGFALDSGWQVLLVALALGAGLPLVFALGVRALAWGTGGDAERAPVAPPPPHPVGRVAAVVCFAVVVLAVALGITVVVSSGLGKAVSFSQGYPTFEDA